MNVTTASLERIDQHWAIQAIGNEEIKRAVELSNRLLVEKAVGVQIHFKYTFSPSDYELLDRVSMAYEMAAIEGMNDFLNPTSTEWELREQCASGAYRAFEIRRLFQIPTAYEQRIFHILHLSSLAYCGDRWTDLRRWYNEEHILQEPVLSNEPWDRRLLNKLFGCWIRLFRKRRWEDLDRIYEIIAELREDQKQYEAEVLNDSSNAENRAMALRLISLYHWAKATEIQAKYILQGEPVGVTTLLNKHFESAIKAATASADSQLEILLRWLQIAGRQMVADSKTYKGIEDRLHPRCKNST
jgi:hypothetical protein